MSEASKLLWRDVYLDDNMLVVQRGKGGRRRELPIHPALKEELKKVALHRPTWPVAGSIEHDRLTPKSMAHIFERWLPKFEVFITAHQLRRTFATQLLRRGATLRDIQLLLGHRSLPGCQPEGLGGRPEPTPRKLVIPFCPFPWKYLTRCRAGAVVGA